MSDNVTRTIPAGGESDKHVPMGTDTTLQQLSSPPYSDQCNKGDDDQQDQCKASILTADDGNDDGDNDGDPINSCTFSTSPFDTSISVILSPTKQNGANDDDGGGGQAEDEDDDDHFVHSFEDEEHQIANNLSANSLPEDMLSRPRFGDAVKVVRLVHSDDDAEDFTHNRYANNLFSLGSSNDDQTQDNELESKSTFEKTEAETETFHQAETYVYHAGTTPHQTGGEGSCNTLTLDGDEAGLYLGADVAPPRLQESDDISSSVVADEENMSILSEDSFVHLMRYCRLISKSEEDPEKENKYEGVEDVLVGSNKSASVAGDETIVSKMTLPGGNTKQHFTSLDVLDIVSMPEEDDAGHNKKGRFTSLDVFGIVFGSCLSCGCGN